MHLQGIDIEGSRFYLVPWSYLLGIFCNKYLQRVQIIEYGRLDHESEQQLHLDTDLGFVTYIILDRYYRL